MFKNKINRTIKQINASSVLKTFQTHKGITNDVYELDCKTKKKIMNSLKILSSFSDIKYLIDLSSYHLPVNYNAFYVFYIFNTLLKSKNIILMYKTNSTMPSITNLYKSSNWLEREVFDLFGLTFTGHTNLRRILTDYGFRGFPLRKDFPVFGYKEVCYDFELRQIVYVGVKLTQNWRTYFFQRQWKVSGR